MTVYVDTMKIPFGRMLMSHMTADTLGELHAMATKIGIGRQHFQDDDRHPHYDVSQSKKGLALGFGAVEVEPDVFLEKVKGLAEGIELAALPEPAVDLDEEIILAVASALGVDKAAFQWPKLGEGALTQEVDDER